ncbi:hypothetical protein N9089_03185 [Crocinitomicaceae bacterium]|nr:hypothetical protein [Crocinitomicaceae bacterium]
MNYTTKITFIYTSGDNKDRAISSPKEDVEREWKNHNTGDQYLPMDIYIDPKTIKEHFQIAA